MTAREKFEAWALNKGGYNPQDLEIYEGEYVDGHANTALDAWQASRTAALEEAAQRVEPRNSPDDWTEYAKIRAEAASDIRALSEPEGE